MILKRIYECPLCKRTRTIVKDTRISNQEFPHEGGPCMCNPHARFILKEKNNGAMT